MREKSDELWDAERGFKDDESKQVSKRIVNEEQVSKTLSIVSN